MPRPRPPEELFTYALRLTRSQIRKVKTLGGSAWVRELISKAQATHHGRDSIEHVRAIAARNRDIGESDTPTKELAAKYLLSVKRVQQIRRQYRA